MKLTIIEDLKKAKPKHRPKILQAIHDKNVAFFKRRNPPLGDALEKLGTGGFVIRFNDQFLDIVELGTNQYAHTPGRLLEYIETVANWHHTGWIDKLEVTHRFTGAHQHGQVLDSFRQALHGALPQIAGRMASGVIQLPRLPGGRRFSGSTVFLGALTGLHIVRYLNTTEVRDIFIIEPDVRKFALSCWFVDYPAIERRFGRLVLHVGEDMPESPLDFLMGTSPIVAGVWLRMLQIYASPYFDEVIGRTNLRWRSIHEILVPFDRELRNLGYGAANLRAGYPILCKTPQLSKKCRIAVVGTGPSLENDIPWLKANEHNLIIFAVHSAVRVLRKHDIRPDFQVTLDTELLDDLPKLQLDPDIPFVVYYKVDPRAITGFKTVLMCSEDGKANPVRFKRPVTYTHPTSGNTAVAVALFMQAPETYLLGLDLGFREAERSHAAGAWHDDEGGAGHGDARWRENVKSKSNFEESEGQIYTHAYYNYSRSVVENAIAGMANGDNVYNLSDGVRIQGAQPRRSGDIALDNYTEKRQDLEAMRAAFVASAEGVWEPYATPGSEMLQSMKDDLLAAVRLKKPDWLEFAKALDTAWSKAFVKKIREDPTDIRIEAYRKLIEDLLADWCRVMIFTRTPSEFGCGYESGLRELEAVVALLQWPDELDFEAVSGEASTVA